MCCSVLSRFSRIWLFAIPWIVAHQPPLSMGFSRQEYWSGLPCPPPRDLPDPGIKPASLTSPALASRFFTIWATKEAQQSHTFGYPPRGQGFPSGAVVKSNRICSIIKNTVKALSVSNNEKPPGWFLFFPQREMARMRRPKSRFLMCILCLHSHMLYLFMSERFWHGVRTVLLWVSFPHE